MARQNINIGTSANKGDGDPLRTAFTKINSNFTELYNAIGLNDGSINISSFVFNGMTITSTDSSRIEIAQEVRITSDLTMRGSIIPNVDSRFDLGSPTNQWRSLYLTGSTVYFNGIPLSVTNDGTILVNGQVAATPGGDLTWDSIVGKPTTTASNGLTATTDVNGNVNIGFSGILYVGSQTQYGFEEIVDESGPSPVYSSRLSLPLITEFLGGDISLTSWGLGLNIKTRNPDPFTDYTWSFRYDGTLIAPSTIAFGDGNRTNINQINNNFVITTNTGPGDPYSWTFDEFGNLTLPGGAVIDTYGDGAGGSTYLWGAPGEVIAVRSMIAENNFGGGIDVRPDGSVDIIAQNISSASWRFNENGSLTFPNLTTQTTAFTGTADIARNIESEGNVSIKVNLSDSTQRVWRFGEDGDLTLPQGGDIKDSNGNSVLGGGGNANTGDITFDGVKIIGNTAPGVPFNAIGLVPDNRTVEGYNFVDNGQFLVVYPTTGFDGDTPHIHIAAGTGPISKGDLIIGDDTQHIDINHNGYVTIKTYDQLRNTNNYWYFTEVDGTLFGPGEGRLLVSSLGGPKGADLNLYPGDVSRNTSDIQFVDADGTSKSVYTVDTGVYFVGNIPAGGSSFLWYLNGFAVMISSIVQGDGTATFTLSDPVTLNPNTSYTVEWPGVNAYDVRVQTQNGDWRFKNDGSFSNRGSFTRTTTPGVNSLQTSAVIWTGLFDYISGAKLTIQLETDEVGDATGWHSQVCEAVIASRGYANSAAGPLGDPVMTVYGVTYTSTTPLVTFTVQRNPTTKRIEVVATRTAATTDSINFRIYSVEMSTRD